MRFDFDPVFRTADFVSYIDEGIPKEVLKRMNLKRYVLERGLKFACLVAPQL